MNIEKFKIVQIDENEFIVEISVSEKRQSGFLWWKKEYNYTYWKHALDFRKISDSGYYDVIIFNSLEEAEKAIENNFKEYEPKYPFTVKEINL